MESALQSAAAALFCGKRNCKTCRERDPESTAESLSVRLLVSTSTKEGKDDASFFTLLGAWEEKREKR